MILRSWGRIGVIAFLLTALSIVYVGRSHADDTFIFMRYADSALSGHGLTFNAGEPTYGFTSTAWLVAMLPIAKAFGNSITVWKAASWLAYGGFAVALLWVAHRAPNRNLALLAAVALAMEPYLFRWSGTGMENAFVALFVIAVCVAWRDVLLDGHRSPMVGLLLGILPLVRPELALFAAAIWLEWVVIVRGSSRWREPFTAAVVAAVVFGASAASIHWFTGAWVPQTAAAKALAAKQMVASYGFRQAGTIILSSGAPIIVLGIWMMRERAARPMIRPALLQLLAFWAYLGVQNQLVSTRYSVTLVLPLLVAVYTALTFTTPPRLTKPALLAQLALSIAVLGYLFPATRSDEGEDIRQFAIRAQAVTSRTDRLAMTEVGAFAFYADRYVIDLVGLTDPSTVAWMRQHGRPQSLRHLERLLAYRGATHFIDGFASAAKPVGELFEFVPLLDGAVERNNLSGDRHTQWRLYRLDRRPLTSQGP